MQRNEYERVIERVAELWPTSRITAERMGAMYPRFRGHSMVDTLKALEAHCCDSPDLTRPHWETVFGMLGRRGGGKSGRNDFEILLNQLRRFNRQHGSDHWTDADAFDYQLQLLTLPILYTTGPTRLCPDPDGTLARRAKAVKDAEYRHWRVHFAEIDEPTPDFLREPE